jgi:hypothetical protein
MTREMTNKIRHISTSVDTFRKYFDDVKDLNSQGEVPTFTLKEGQKKLSLYFIDTEKYYSERAYVFLTLILEHIALVSGKMIAKNRGVSVEEVIDNAISLYERKNADYGDAFYIAAERFGLGTCMARMFDKLERLKNAWRGNDLKVTEEKAEDTLIDLMCYSMMTVLYIKESSKH